MDLHVQLGQVNICLLVIPSARLFGLWFIPNLFVPCTYTGVIFVGEFRNKHTTDLSNHIPLFYNNLQIYYYFLTKLSLFSTPDPSLSLPATPENTSPQKFWTHKPKREMDLAMDWGSIVHEDRVEGTNVEGRQREI